MGMPWVVTVKHCPDKKIKARLIILRYQAGDFEDELLEAATPTPTRRAKHCFLQVAAHHCFDCKVENNRQTGTWFQTHLESQKENQQDSERLATAWR